MENYLSNYYPDMYQQPSSYHNTIQGFFPNNNVNPCDVQPNRFIYVKQNFIQPSVPAKPSTVLVNPHFNKKVYVNPQFKATQSIPMKPKIHVNPNFVKATPKLVPKPEPIVTPAKVEPKAANPVRTVISTRTKIVRVPQACTSTAEKRVVRKKRVSINTKYKFVKSGNNTFKSKYKLDKRKQTSSNMSLTRENSTLNRSISKKKYVYVNRFLSMSVMAKSVLLKQNPTLMRPGLVNINGILYKKSPNSLKKAPIVSSFSLVKGNVSAVRKTVRKQSLRLNSTRNSVVKRYKVVRSRKVSLRKLKKCNLPCEIFRKTGKCKGKDRGSCIKVHNADQIVLCTRFLQGACLNKNCFLSHKVSLEKMPTCKYYLDGLCTRDDCPYLHVKINPKADICRKFLEGFCQSGAKCEKRHQFLCPDFEKNRSCPKKKCPYPHGNLVRKSKVFIKSVAKKCSIKRNDVNSKTCSLRKPLVQKCEDTKNSAPIPESNRYYKDRESNSLGETKQADNVINANTRDRPTLGQLPAFIPFFDNCL